MRTTNQIFWITQSRANAEEIVTVLKAEFDEIRLVHRENFKRKIIWKLQNNIKQYTVSEVCRFLENLEMNDYRFFEIIKR